MGMLVTSIMSRDAKSTSFKETDPRVVINPMSVEANHRDIKSRI